MRIRSRSLQLAALTIAAAFVWSGISFAQTPTAAQALRLTPVQKDVNYDVPAEADAAKCTIKAEKVGAQTGWVVRDPNGQMLREFVDTNKDNVVDRWSYYKDGIEIYRDVDENFNGKADNHRWLNTSGTRWGLDRNEDGRIDAWKMISPEEVSAELVMALRDRDDQRFSRLLLTDNELTALGLGADKAKALREKLDKAVSQFRIMMGRQKAVTNKTNWIHFAANKPALIPAGTDGSKGDIVVYENVIAMIETDGKDDQMPVGTIVKAGEVWRLIDLPALPGATDKTQELTFFIPYRDPSPAGDAATGGPSEALQKLIDEAQKLDAELNKAPQAQQAKLNERRADVLEAIIAEIDAKERAVWIRSYADSISAAVQSGGYPDGLERLGAMIDKLAKAEDTELAAYTKFRYLTAQYGQSLQQSDADFGKIQTAWLDNLEKFVAEYPKSTDAADAMLQLGMAEEFAGKEDKAKSWYNKIIDTFADTPPGKKAAGAVARLDSVGKTISLRGKAIAGEAVDLSKLRGKVVVIHYWATTCEPCKVDIAQLKELQTKYGKDSFALVGISLDHTAQELVDYLKRNKLPWPQLFEPGGLDSRYANEMGILTLPTMLLIDDKGKVVNRGVHITELDNELKSLLK
jgi:thiol-disulfide isomerase/thioredoxin